MPSVRVYGSEAPGRLISCERVGFLASDPGDMDGLDFLLYGPVAFDALNGESEPGGQGLTPT